MTRLNQFWQVQTNFDKFKSILIIWSRFNKIESILTSLNQFWQVWTNFDKFDTNLTSMGQFWQTWLKFDKIDQAWVWSNLTWHDHLLTSETWFMTFWLPFLTKQARRQKSDSKMGAYAPIKNKILWQLSYYHLFWLCREWILFECRKARCSKQDRVRWEGQKRRRRGGGQFCQDANSDWI